MKKAWEKELEILQAGEPCYQEDDNETIWEEAGTYTPAHRDEITWEFSDFQ